MTPITKKQWKSVVLNTLLAFLSTFLTTLAYSSSFDKATLFSAAAAGLMAGFKVLEKLGTQE